MFPEGGRCDPAPTAAQRRNFLASCFAAVIKMDNEHLRCASVLSQGGSWGLRTGNVPGAGAGVAPAAAMGPGGAVN